MDQQEIHQQNRQGYGGRRHSTAPALPMEAPHISLMGRNKLAPWG